SKAPAREEGAAGLARDLTSFIARPTSGEHLPSYRRRMLAVRSGDLNLVRLATSRPARGTLHSSRPRPRRRRRAASGLRARRSDAGAASDRSRRLPIARTGTAARFPPATI